MISAIIIAGITEIDIIMPISGLIAVAYLVLQQKKNNNKME